MGRLYTEYLEGRIYCCSGCQQHVAQQSKLVSRQFHSKLGRAYLFDSVVNVVAGPEEERLMTTGLHVIRDISCSRCLQPLGWKYEVAHEASQKYKEGKSILERVQVVAVHTAMEQPPRDGALCASESSDEACDA